MEKNSRSTETPRNTFVINLNLSPPSLTSLNSRSPLLLCNWPTHCPLPGHTWKKQTKCCQIHPPPHTHTPWCLSRNAATFPEYCSEDNGCSTLTEIRQLSSVGEYLCVWDRREMRVWLCHCCLMGGQSFHLGVLLGVCSLSCVTDNHMIPGCKCSSGCKAWSGTFYTVYWWTKLYIGPLHNLHRVL